MLFPFAVARETSRSWRRHVHPCFAHPSGCRVFIAKSKTEFQHPAGSAIPSGLSSVDKRCEQRKMKTSDGMTEDGMMLAHKRSRRVTIFDNSRTQYSCLVFPSVIDAYLVLVFWILLSSSPPGYPILSVVCRLAAVAEKVRIVEYASGKFFRWNDAYEKEQTSLLLLSHEIEVALYIDTFCKNRDSEGSFLLL